MKLYSYIIQQVASIVEVDGVGEMLSKVLWGFESLINEFIVNSSIQANKSSQNTKLIQLQQSKAKIE